VFLNSGEQCRDYQRYAPISMELKLEQKVPDPKRWRNRLLSVLRE
jgi:hypothetical protein